MTREITGTTRVAGVIGSPITHSLSPVLHNAAIDACGLDWVYTAFEVPAGGGAAAVEAARTFGLAGLSVTMPLKAEVAAAVDRLDATAAQLDAVNCVVPTAGAMVGHNTDGAGFLAALDAETARLGIGSDLSDRAVLVLGAGGAARAVVLALAGRGAWVSVWNRTTDRAAATAELAGARGAVVDSPDPRAFDVIVNATSVGMAGTPAAGALPLDGDGLRAGQVVVDLVYHPVETPLLVAAGRSGAHCVDGLGMLVHQAAEAFRLWSGLEPPVEAMSDAARRAIPPAPRSFE